MIHIIRINGKERIFEIAVTLSNIYDVVSILEKQKLEFKVISSSGIQSQKEFGYGNMKYWVTKFSHENEQ